MKRDSDRGKQRTRGGKGIVAGGSRGQGEERDSDRESKEQGELMDSDREKIRTRLGQSEK